MQWFRYNRIESYTIHPSIDTVVQQRYERDLELGKWVQTQRRLEKEGKLKEERKAALEELGFDWKIGVVGERSWQDNFERLLAFKEKWVSWFCQNWYCKLLYLLTYFLSIYREIAWYQQSTNQISASLVG